MTLTFITSDNQHTIRPLQWKVGYHRINADQEFAQALKYYGLKSNDPSMDDFDLLGGLDLVGVMVNHRNGPRWADESDLTISEIERLTREAKTHDHDNR